MTERPVGLTRDAGWEIGVSRTFPVDVEAAWDFLLSAEGLALWLGPGLDGPPAPGERYETADGADGEGRSLRPHDRIRLTWRPAGRDTDVTVQVALRPSPRGCSVRFHAERLASAEEREAMRDRWAGALDRLRDAMPAA